MTITPSVSDPFEVGSHLFTEIRWIVVVVLLDTARSLSMSVPGKAAKADLYTGWGLVTGRGLEKGKQTGSRGEGEGRREGKEG